MKKPKKSRRLFESFMDEYTGKAEARRVRETAKRGPAIKPHTRSVEPSMSSYRVQALEQENAALRLQIAAQQRITVVTAAGVNDFEQEYNKPEPVEEDAPKRRKIVLDS